MDKLFPEFLQPLFRKFPFFWESVFENVLVYVTGRDTLSELTFDVSEHLFTGESDFSLRLFVIDFCPIVEPILFPLTK